MHAIAGIVLWLVIFTGGVMIAGESPLLMWDPASVMVVTGFDLAAMIVSGSSGDVFAGLIQLFKKETVLTKTGLIDSAEAFGLLSWCSITGGILGLIMGLIMLLVNFKNLPDIGPCLSVPLVTLLYGPGLSVMIFLPGRNRLMKLARNI